MSQDINNSLTCAPSEIKLWLRRIVNDEVCVSALHWHSLRSPGGFFVPFCHLVRKEKNKKPRGRKRGRHSLLNDDKVLERVWKSGSAGRLTGSSLSEQTRSSGTASGPRRTRPASSGWPPSPGESAAGTAETQANGELRVFLLTGYIAQLQSYAYCTVVHNKGPVCSSQWISDFYIGKSFT